MTAESKAAEPGRDIGPYRLLARLGAGAMGEVWRALDTRLDRLVAVKVLPSALARDPERRARMLREAKAAAAVPHPNVVTLFDIESDGDQDCLVMELVDGRTVAEILKDGRLELKKALGIAIGVTDALAAAHRKGILHRDVKAANVMVSRDGGVKVLDFGLAKLRSAVSQPHGMSPPAHGGGGGVSSLGGRASDAAMPATPAPKSVALDATAAPGPTASISALDATAAPRPKSSSPALDATIPSQGGSVDETREGTLLGTPAYFSPEQVEGKLPDERSEIFTAGVLVYELVDGKSPFAADTIDKLFAKILAGKPPPPDAPDPVRAAIMKALAPDPKDRHEDMAAFAAALRTAHDELFTPRRARWPWVLAAAIFAAALAAGAVWWQTRPAKVSRADRYVEQAIGEYDVFYNDKANGSLRAAMKVAPDDPRPHAYLVLMGHAPEDERRAAATEALARVKHATRARDRALVHAAAALMTDGPAAARKALAEVRGDDRELRFWDAELAFRAGQFDDAAAGYKALLESPLERFRGRIFDHYVACLLYRDRIDEAVAIGEAYAREYPGEADAIGVHATTLASAGKLDDALRLAREARDLNESEDTLAGLAKIHVLRGELAEAERLYRRSVALAPATRRPLRRAALGALLLMNQRVDEAREVVKPCLPGGEDTPQRTTSVCLFVAGLVDADAIPSITPELERRAEVPPPAVPYGRPDALARILKARHLVEKVPAVDATTAEAAEGLLHGADDLYLSYHLPFLSSYVPRFRAQIRVLTGDPAGAIRELESSLKKRPADPAALLQLAGAQVETGDRAGGLRTLDTLDALWKTADKDAFVVRRAADLRQKLMQL